MFSHIQSQLNSIRKLTSNFFKIHFTSHPMYVFVWTLEDIMITAYIQRLGIKIPHSAHTVYLWVLCDFKHTAIILTVQEWLPIFTNVRAPTETVYLQLHYLASLNQKK